MTLINCNKRYTLHACVVLCFRRKSKRRLSDQLQKPQTTQGKGKLSTQLHCCLIIPFSHSRELLCLWPARAHREQPQRSQFNADGHQHSAAGALTSIAHASGLAALSWLSAILADSWSPHMHRCWRSRGQWAPLLVYPMPLPSWASAGCSSSGRIAPLSALLFWMLLLLLLQRVLGWLDHMLAQLGHCPAHLPEQTHYQHPQHTHKALDRAVSFVCCSNGVAHFAANAAPKEEEVSEGPSCGLHVSNATPGIHTVVYSTTSTTLAVCDGCGLLPSHPTNMRQNASQPHL